MARIPVQVTVEMTLDAAVLRLISEFKPPITRPHDVVSLKVTRTEVVAEVLERDDHGWPVWRGIPGMREYATITRRQTIPVHIMEADE